MFEEFLDVFSLDEMGNVDLLDFQNMEYDGMTQTGEIDMYQPVNTDSDEIEMYQPQNTSEPMEMYQPQNMGIPSDTDDL